MITGMGIPRAKAVDPYPSCNSPTLLLTTERQDEDRKNGGFYAGIATNISLHLTVINGTREQSVPVMQQTYEKKTARVLSEVCIGSGTDVGRQTISVVANFAGSTKWRLISRRRKRKPSAASCTSSSMESSKPVAGAR